MVAKNGKTDSRFGFDKKRRKKEEEERLESLLTRWRGRGARYRWVSTTESEHDGVSRSFKKNLFATAISRRHRLGPPRWMAMAIFVTMMAWSSDEWWDPSVARSFLLRRGVEVFTVGPHGWQWRYRWWWLRAGAVEKQKGREKERERRGKREDVLPSNWTRGGRYSSNQFYRLFPPGWAGRTIFSLEDTHRLFSFATMWTARRWFLSFIGEGEGGEKKEITVCSDRGKLNRLCCLSSLSRILLQCLFFCFVSLERISSKVF